MVNFFSLISQKLPDLSNIQHPLEGISYLIVLGILYRTAWPRSWNSILKSISADIKEVSDSKENR